MNILNAITKYFTELDIAGYIGLAASVVVLVSFLMKEIRIVRTISIVACIAFVIYGVMIDELPIWLLNGVLIFVHIYFLIRNKKPKSGTHRLQKLDRESFNKKDLRETPWFLLSDVE